jgi:methenyltetrahydromethanopterin cyclohydrolase
LCQNLLQKQQELRVALADNGSSPVCIDCGINQPGCFEAGRLLAEICLAGLGSVEFVPGSAEFGGGLNVAVRTDHPVAACMASQYAGWQLSHGKFFALGSGPMRAVGSSEKLFEKIGYRESAEYVVGVLESRKLPPVEICQQIADACRVAPKNLTLLVAPTASYAGTVQVVARSVATALHKLYELGFDLHTIESGYGVAPLPPVAADDLVGIGRTNDSILYGAEVTLWVNTTDQMITSLGPQVPSSASKDFGQPFAEIFKRYDHDFYKIDPHLFSPACVTFCNRATGNAFRFGKIHPQIVRQSFGVTD